MDIERVNIVFNYDMPEDSDTYLHRVSSAIIVIYSLKSCLFSLSAVSYHKTLTDLVICEKQNLLMCCIGCLANVYCECV